MLGRALVKSVVSQAQTACAGRRDRARAGGRRTRSPPCRSARRACARSSTRPASSCTPTSAGHRCRGPRSTRWSPPAGATDVEFDLAHRSARPPRPRCAGRAGRRGARRGRRARGQQQRRRPAAHRDDPGAGQGDRGQPRRADRDRRRLPAARAAGVDRCRGSARSARPTARTSATTPTRSGPTPASCSRSTRRTITSPASPRRSRSPSWRRSDVPLVVDIGSGLLPPHPLLPDEPDAATALRDGADLVTASGDKLLGGPQAGLLLGDAELDRAAAPASRGARAAGRQADPRRAGGDPARSAAAGRRRRCDADVDGAARHGPQRLAAQLPDAQAVDCDRGGRRRRCARRGAAQRGGQPAGAYAAPLRTGDPAVVGRLEGGRCLLDLRTVAPERRRGAACRRGAGMHVVATAGHVDHGKSTLVQRLTGM